MVYHDYYPPRTRQAARRLHAILKNNELELDEDDLRGFKREDEDMDIDMLTSGSEFSYSGDETISDAEDGQPGLEPPTTRSRRTGRSLEVQGTGKGGAKPKTKPKSSKIDVAYENLHTATRRRKGGACGLHSGHPSSKNPITKERKSTYLTAPDRKKVLDADPYTMDVKPFSVICRRCSKEIRLDKRARVGTTKKANVGMYYAWNWEKHKAICLDIKGWMSMLQQIPWGAKERQARMAMNAAEALLDMQRSSS